MANRALITWLLDLVIMTLAVDIGCSRVSTRNPPATAAARYAIVSFQSEFEAFWAKAATAPLDQQIELWDRLVETPRQSFYDDVVWEKKDDPDWLARKRRRLSQIFPQYSISAISINQQFAAFPGVVAHQMARFERLFPQPKITAPIYAALAPTFNGRSASLVDDSGHSITILAFGIDMIAVRHDALDILFPHEFFHIYRAQVANISNDGKSVNPNAKLTLPLFEEGLATYVSGVANPDRSSGELLMDPGLGNVPTNRVPWLARKFLEQANEKAFDSEKPQIYKSWFNLAGVPVAPDLPTRCGYLLGLEVARELSKTVNLGTMARWSGDETHRHVIEALVKLSAE